MGTLRSGHNWFYLFLDLIEVNGKAAKDRVVNWSQKQSFW